MSVLYDTPTVTAHHVGEEIEERQSWKENPSVGRKEWDF